MADLALVELVLVVILFLLAGAARRTWSKWLLRFETRFDGVARRRTVSVLIVIGLCLGGRLALLPLVEIPTPGVHDEFSYLLAADTFASGRLTNPKHPMWKHFETFHVNQRPTYQSMYQPAQGLTLAAGKVLFGHPWFGVWLSTGIMCGVISWALYGWLPPRWALLGGLIAVMRLGIFSYWMNSYWGGSVPAVGGALVAGALPRLIQSPRARDSLLMALGIALLAYSRPWEGAVLTLAALLVLGYSLRRQANVCYGQVLHRVILPLSVVLLVAGVGLMYYFWRVTGNPFLMPFQVNRATYAYAQSFYWQKLPSIPLLRHQVMSDFYLGKELDWYRRSLTFSGFVKNQAEKLQRVWLFYVGPVLLIPLVMLGQLIHDRRIRAVWVIVLASVVAIALETWPLSLHYAAPFLAAIYVVLLQGMRHWRATNRRTSGPVIAWGIPLICVMMLVIRTGAAVPRLQDYVSVGNNAWWCYIPGGIANRDRILQELRTHPGKHLVLVHYENRHDVVEEWVYNGANIDSQKVVWARDMGDAANQELVKYYSSRDVWMVDADAAKPQLVSYADARGKPHVVRVH